MLPWREMLRAAAMMGIGPGAFWQLSVREWQWLAAGEATDLAALRTLLGQQERREKT